MSGIKSFSLGERIKRFKYAFNGIALLFRSQHNARIHALATVISCGAGLYFGITKTEWCFVVSAISIVLVTESLNTALEFICNEVSPDYNKLIGEAKDVAAAAVLLASIGAAVIGVIIFMPYVMKLL